MRVFVAGASDVLGLEGKYESAAQAKARAGRMYRGVSSRWIDAKITPDEALKFRDETRADYRCSFCNKIPPQFNKMVARNNVRICDLCVAELQKMFSEESSSEE